MIRFEESVVHRLWLGSGIASVLAIVVGFVLLRADEGGESPADIAMRFIAVAEWKVSRATAAREPEPEGLV